MEKYLANHRYFQSKTGRWRGRVLFEITDPQLLKASLRPCDRWSVRWMAFISRRLSTLKLATTVEYASHTSGGEVRHTTRISNLGITLFRSEEIILPGDDGRSFRMTGLQAFFPRLWKPTGWAAHG